MSAISNWWNNGDLGSVSTTVEIDRKSIVFIAVALIAVAAVIIFMYRTVKK